MVVVESAVPAATCEAAWENVQTPTANEFDPAEPKGLWSVHAAFLTIGLLGARSERHATRVRFDNTSIGYRTATDVTRQILDHAAPEGNGKSKIRRSSEKKTSKGQRRAS